MSAPTRPFDADRLERLVEYTKTLDCIHCGLCLQTCPTYRLTGVESSSPRGRIHLMRGVAEGDTTPDAEYAEELDFCLVCRHCETACPAGVRFGELMEHARSGLETEKHRPWYVRAARRVGLRGVLPHRFVLRALGAVLRVAARTRIDRIGVALLARVRGERPALPEIPPISAQRALPASTPADGDPRGAVHLLEGCVMPVLFGRVNRATAASLAGIGYESRPLAKAVCCGSLHAHNGDRDGARALARTLLAADRAATEAEGEPLPLVVNSAGCSSHLKELGQLFEPGSAERAAADEFASRVYDFSEFVAPRIRRNPPERSLEGAFARPFAYDDPCHLCHAQDVRQQPREILDALPGAACVPLANSEGCCGSAGLYALVRPTDSRAVLAPKLDDLERSGARTLVTANPGCHAQWQAGIAERGLDVEVVHLAELVARAYAGRTVD